MQTKDKTDVALGSRKSKQRLLTSLLPKGPEVELRTQCWRSITSINCKYNSVLFKGELKLDSL